MATESNKITASDILKVLGGLALGGLAGGALGRAGALGRGPATTGRKLPTPTEVLLNTATTYPSLTQDFNYEVLWRPGLPWRNRSVDRQIARNSAVAQNIDEHNRAVADGTEQDLLPWWPTEDTKPRKEFGAGSSAVDGVKILPDNKIMVHFAGKPSSKNPSNWYTYLGGRNPQESSEIVKDLLISSSIGQSLARNSNKGDNGWWAKKYYDPSSAK